MQTIAEKLQKIKNATAKIKDSIVEKGGTIDGDISTWYSAIDNLETGESDGDDVIFYDYDGSILYSYGANKFLSLVEMPELPVREGLICQEWNWSFDEAHNYVSKYGKCDIGATYITDDGKTRIYIEIDEYNKGSVGIVFLCKAIGDIYIDWGDGSDIVTNTFTSVDSYKQMNHTYNNIGRYCISIDVSQGCEVSLGRGTSSKNFIGESRLTLSGTRYKKIELGGGIVLSQYCFNYLPNLESITIPNKLAGINTCSFMRCANIKHITLPKNTSALAAEFTYNCFSLESLSMPPSITEIGQSCFYNCHKLHRIVIPDSCVTINRMAANNCQALSCVIIPDSVVDAYDDIIQSCDYLFIGSGVQTFSTSSTHGDIRVNKVVLNNNPNMDKIYTKSKIVAQHYVFNFSDIERFSQYCERSGLNYEDGIKHIYINGDEVSHLEIPDTALQIGQYAFAKCVGLKEVSIPYRVETVGSSSFANCTNLKKIAIHDAATISSPFGACFDLEEITINSLTISSGSLCYQLGKLKKVTFGANVSEITERMFHYCYLLSEVYFNGNITSIETPVFDYCGIRVVDFSHNTGIPTLESSSFISNNGYTVYKIIVPDNLYDEWIVATNWSSHKSRIVKKSDWDAQNT